MCVCVFFKSCTMVFRKLRNFILSHRKRPNRLRVFRIKSSTWHTMLSMSFPISLFPFRLMRQKIKKPPLLPVAYRPLLQLEIEFKPTTLPLSLFFPYFSA